MPIVQAQRKPKDCESLMVKFIKLKKVLNGISTTKTDSILKGKIPDLKEIHRRLHKD